MTSIRTRSIPLCAPRSSAACTQRRPSTACAFCSPSSRAVVPGASRRRDSDYDVRFLYVHPSEWYLSFDVERRRDVIDYPIVDEIDCGGWDVRKALYLFTRSNGALLEWLKSPIVYGASRRLCRTPVRARANVHRLSGAVLPLQSHGAPATPVSTCSRIGRSSRSTSTCCARSSRSGTSRRVSGRRRWNSSGSSKQWRPRRYGRRSPTCWH